MLLSQALKVPNNVHLVCCPSKLKENIYFVYGSRSFSSQPLSVLVLGLRENRHPLGVTSPFGGQQTGVVVRGRDLV